MFDYLPVFTCRDLYELPVCLSIYLCLPVRICMSVHVCLPVYL